MERHLSFSGVAVNAHRRVSPSFVIWILLILYSMVQSPGLAAQVQRPGGGQQQQQAGGGGCPPEGCGPKLQIIGHTFAPVGRQADAGPYTYTITVQNNGDQSTTVEVECIALSSQLPCATPSPEFFTLGVSASQVVTVGYSTLGVGTFKQKHRVVSGGGILSMDSVTVGDVIVGGPSFIAHVFPADSAELRPADTLFASLGHPSGVNTGSLHLYIDGTEKSATITSTTLKATAAALNLSSGWHTWKTTGCANNGRCDTVATAINVVGPPAAWSMDDSLPAPVGSEPLYGLLPGALPLPPANYRGCPVAANYPEIRLTQPFTYISQPGSASAPSGLIFMAGVVGSTPIFTISATTFDYKASDNRTCANSYTYLDQGDYDWSYWGHSDPNDPLWSSYPYGDLALGGAAEEGYEYAMAFDSPAHGPNAMGEIVWGSTRRNMLTARVNRLLRRKSTGPALRTRPTTPLIPDPGDIDSASYTVTLNGTTIINNGVSVRTGVVKVDLQRFGSTFTMPWTDPLINTYNASNPTANNGGWNELIASIADTGGRRTYVRARFVRIGTGAPAPLTLTALRSTTRESQGDCAAFGVLQCGGVFLSQTIPGFVTRDKERSLHLVYRSESQRAPTILPLQLDISRLQMAPESLQVRTLVAGAQMGQTLHYAGTKGTVSGWMASNIWEDANETRVVGGELPAVSSGNYAIRSVQIAVRSFYGAQGTREDTLSQDVVEVHLSDTTTARLGPGWSIAEQSRLYLGQSLQGAPAATWVSGDGSYAVFRKVNNVWLAPPGVAAQLTDLGSNLDDWAQWVISLPNGTRFGYTASGYLRWAADLVNNRSVYQYTGARLIRITDPTGARYLIQYNAGNAPGQIGDIYIQGPGQADSTKVATLRYDAGKRLRRVDIWRSATQADSTLFAYGTSSYGAYITSVTDPRSPAGQPIQTTFVYDSILGTPITVQRPDPSSGAGLSAKFRDHWRRAVPRLGYGRPGNPLERTVHLTQLRGTYVPFEGMPTDFTVDRFGGPTWVRQIVPEPPLTFPPTPSGGDVVRHIERDSLGRVTKIVAARDSFEIADSVMYQYDALNRITRLIKNTAAYPTGATTLDTVSCSWDTVTVYATPVSAGGAWCSRLHTTTDPMGGVTRTLFGGADARKCMSIVVIGLNSDSTTFSYNSLVAGVPSATRPYSVRGPNGISESVTYNSTNWNTATQTRDAISATTSVFYNAYGRADSVVDPEGRRNRILYDLSGRVTYQRVGSGSQAPVTQT
ncbi:MAG: hypothetical protein AB7I33_11350, partial [Gemmatimonadales bacterium]